MKRVVLVCAAVVLLAGLAQPAGATSLLLLSGDENIANALTGNAVPVDPGNQRFFSNLLGGGTTVLVHGQNVGGVDQPVTSIDTYYNSLVGVNSSILSGPVTPAALAGVDLFVSAIPASPFAPTEVTALSAFLAGGGSVFLLGDWDGFASAWNLNINGLLVGLGSSMLLANDAFDLGFHGAVGAQIAVDPLTSGVTSLSYAAVSSVIGGTPLFYTLGGEPFIAYEGTPGPPVPEPASLLLLGTGLLGVARSYWKRR